MGRTRRVALTEAAQVLGISKEAVRKRVSRGTLPSDVGEDDRRYVYLDAGPPGDHDLPDYGDPREELIATLRDELEAEREANRENRRIIAALDSRIPEIEPAPETRESPERGGEEPTGTSPPPEQQETTSRERSWWRRMFGG